MLVLKVSAGRKIKCGDATIEVLSVTGREVRLGFDAPRETPIYRGECAEQREIITMTDYAGKNRRKVG